MLVLTRQRGESIQIGGGITVVVVEIRGDKVRLGVQAPLDTPVFRREIYDAIKRESAGEPGEANGGMPEAVGG